MGSPWRLAVPDPVYSDRRVRRVSFTGVEPGTIVDYSSTTEELKPFLPGDFYQTWGVPTDAAQVFDPTAAHTALRVRLPTGWRAQPPTSVKAEGPFGSYESVYAQEGDELRVTRRVRGARGGYPPSARPELAAWMRAVAEDDASLVVLTRGAAPAAGNQ